MMKSPQELYEAWLGDPGIDEATKEELRSIAGKDAEIEDRFYRDLEFGTGGLRGVMGAGTNRMNRYVIGKATQGFAEYLLKQGPSPSVVIAHDSRHNSDVFSLEAACVLAANGIKTYLFRSLRPTPQLSFSVRHLGAAGGIVITASHNPPEYNGYKVYAADGCQLVPHQAEQVIESIRGVASFDAVKRLSQAEAEAKGLLVWLGDEDDQAFVDAVKAQVVQPEMLRRGAGDALSVVYTPLHGAGNLPVRQVLEQAGFGNVHVVWEQEQPNGAFPTVKSPNPEEHDAFKLAIELADQVGADIIIGTDPDCDRMGSVVKNDAGEYVVLTGNQAGAIMVHYLLSNLKEQGKLPKNGTVIKTIVTSQMGADIAQSFGCKVIDTLTGFKYIGEQMTKFEGSDENVFLFGYEESYGYLTGTYARDKDAVVASLLISEAAAYYKSLGKTLYDVLLELYRQYGTYLEKLESRTLKGKDGLEKIGAIMNDWRSNPPAEVAGVKVERVLDYAGGLDGLPPENVLKFLLADGSWFCLRPSGTEPKIKLYFAVRGDDLDAANASLGRLVSSVMERVDALA
uniref:Phosphoglucomutase n=2 Tax=Cohnella candidum TaxID=2674991 RepID=A0A3G3K181_9BACL|nr:phospho-sugar mutase [Cohnella candidum]AYQ74182.1 phospho-sugar mutase [Cohnella candidum]